MKWAQLWNQDSQKSIQKGWNSVENKIVKIEDYVSKNGK